MDPTHSKRVREAFSAALAVDGAEQHAVVAHFCDGDPELHREVEALLAADRAAAQRGFLASEPWSNADGDRPDPLLGCRLGPYEVRRLIDQGGMGQVYEAVRVEDFSQRVAVKIMRRGLQSDPQRERFSREVQVLASLGEHPNVARLYSAGMFDQQLPYFAMEYIEGQRIDTFCDQRQCSIAERLKLFLSVCAGVEFAHQHMIVHRDLKPTNILVAIDGVPKLIDFGISKLLDDDQSGASRTVTAQQLLTPEYASPEQVRGEPVTTASDVYSLGIVLYELLTGMRPYELKTASPTELVRVICEQEPRAPSTLLRVRHRAARATAAVASELETLAARRASTVGRLPRQLAGDLDAILLKALRKEQRHRYRTVEQLADDLRRHLEGHPVGAREGAWTYTAGKFVRRHRAALAIVSLAVLLLLGGIVGTSWQALRAEQARALAQLEADNTRNIYEYVVKDLLGSAHPDRLGHKATVQEVLQKATQTLDDRFRGDPKTEAAVRHTLAEALDGVGLPLEAAAQFERAYKLRRQEFGPNNHHTLTSQVGLGNILDELTQFQRAEELLRDAVARAEQSIGPDDELTLAAQQNLGETLQTVGEYDEAQPLLRRAITGFRRLHDSDVSWTEAQTSLAASLMAQGDLAAKAGDQPIAAVKYDEAEKLYAEVLSARQAANAAEHPAVLNTLNNLANLQFRRKNYVAAEKSFRELVAIAAERLPATYHGTPLYHQNLAMSLVGQRRLAEAAPYVISSYEKYRALYGDDNDHTEHTLFVMARFHEDWAREDPAQHSKALDYLDQYVRLKLARCSITGVEKLPKLLRELIDKQSVEQGSDQRPELLKSWILDAGKDRTADSRLRMRYSSNLGTALIDLEEFDVAQGLLKQALELSQSSTITDDHDGTWIAAQLVRLYEEWNKPELAEPLRPKPLLPASTKSER